MNGLVPEKRPDCNGRVVTRWVKPSASTPGAVIPAATVSLAPERTPGEIGIAIATGLWGEMDSWSFSTGLKLNPDVLRRGFSRLPLTSLQAVERGLEGFDFDNLDVVGRMLTHACARLGTVADSGALLETALHYAVELAPVINAFCDEADDLSYRCDAVTNVATFMETSHRATSGALLLADGRERAIARGLAANLALVGDFGTLDGDEMLWIGQNLDRLLPYREVLQERGPIRRAEAERLFSTAAGAFASGAL